MIPTIGPRGDPLKICWYCVFTAIAHESAMGDLCTYSRAFRGYTIQKLEKRCFMYCDPPGSGQVTRIRIQASWYSFVCAGSYVQSQERPRARGSAYRPVGTDLYVQSRVYRIVSTGLDVDTRVYRFARTDLYVQTRAYRFACTGLFVPACVYRLAGTDRGRGAATQWELGAGSCELGAGG